MKKEITGLSDELLTKLRSCYIAERRALSAKLPINEVQWFSPFARRILELYANNELLTLSEALKMNKYFITVEKTNSGNYSDNIHAAIQHKCGSIILAQNDKQCFDESFIANQLFKADKNMWDCFIENYSIISVDPA